VTVEPDDEVRVRRLALTVEYEGTAYAGSQYQKNASTIQGELEKALSQLTGGRTRVALAGRTDAGVHAKGQVASFRVTTPHEPDVFVRALNHYLPQDIAVRRAWEVPLAFDVRRQACRRWYRYAIYNGRERRARFRRYCWHVSEPLDVEAMQEAAAYLVGVHDLTAFGAATGPANSVRTVYRAEVSRCRSWVLFDMEANAFLPQQVRRTVGALVRVGLGKEGPGDFHRLLTSGEGGAATFAAPAHGLCLMAVRYEGLPSGGCDSGQS
jgi:tRNA pseudouridine38-40 synthase